MKTALIVSGVITLGSTISAFTWVPDAATAGRDWVSDPLRTEFKESFEGQTKLMASMKHYDVRTDELAADVRTRAANIRDKEKYIEDHLSAPLLSPDQSKVKMFLEHQIDTDRKEMEMKIELLNESLGEESKLLQHLSQA